MSKLDQKLKASIKPKHGKTAAPSKSAAAAKPAVKPAPAPRAEAPAPARASTAKTSKASALFPERVWPD